jgi:integrase/recombinase XerD
VSAEPRNVPAVIGTAAPVKPSSLRATLAVPAAIADAGEHAARRFLEFFAANIRNKNTRMAYYRAVCSFFAWVEQHRIGELADIEPVHVAAYIEALQTTASKPTVKQHLAAIRMLFDWLIIGQVLAVNPAHAARGPKHVVKRGKTPVLTEDQARNLLDSIDVTTLVGLRDRALIGVMIYSFARIGAVVAMRVGDYYPGGKRWWVRLHEKGGKRHEMPAHHKLEHFLDEYLAAAGPEVTERSDLTHKRT